MARLPESFNFGDRQKMNIEDLLVVLERMYVDLAEAINSKPDLVQRTVDGQASDVFLAQGTLNINLGTNRVQMLTNHNSTTNVTWTTLS